MLLQDTLVRSGNALFRWRSLVVVGFVPFMALALRQGEPIEAALSAHGGPLWGDAYEVFAMAVAWAGLALRVATVGFVPGGTSGRNTKGQVAHHLNTTGVYSIMRNPLYLGNAMMYLGLALCTQSLVVVGLMALVLTLYFERIIAAEERFLSQTYGAPYQHWVAVTPVFLPRLSGWIPPALPFCWRTALRREYPGAVALVLMLFAIDWGQHAYGGEAAALEAWAYGVALAALLAAVVLRLILLCTRWLHVPGR